MSSVGISKCTIVGISTHSVADIVSKGCRDAKTERVDILEIQLISEYEHIGSNYSYCIMLSNNDEVEFFGYISVLTRRS